jgi:hypothetical protein
MCKQALAFLVVVSAVVQASFARADGTITGLTLSLPAIKTCVAETITVNGMASAQASSSITATAKKSSSCRPEAIP